MTVSKSAFFSAAKSWDARTVQMLLRTTADLIHAREPRGRGAIHIACAVKPGTSGTREPNGLRTISALLEAGADLHGYVPLENGKFKATPVWYAVAHGDNLPLVKMLIKRGATVDNCLYAAVWNDNAAMLRAILKTGVTIDDAQGGEPVIVSAVRWRKLKALDILIDAGADASATDAKGRDAVYYARARKLPASLIARLDKNSPTQLL